jgi:hypothetical protein
MSTSAHPESRPPARRAGDRLRRTCSAWLAVVAAAWSIGIAAWSRGDELVLRPSVKLKDKQFVGFDEDGVRLGLTTRPIGWDQIVGGTLANDQARFDRLREALGEPLRQIHQALTEGTYAAALEPAEALFPRFADRHSTSAYMVSQSLVWARLALHKPEEAIEPYLVCLTLHQTVKDLGALPGRRRLQYDSKTGLSPDLPLIGFDRDRAAAALPGARARMRKLGETAPAGLRLYLAALAMAANDVDAVDAELTALASSVRNVAEIADALRAQGMAMRGQTADALNRLKEIHKVCLDANKPLVGYWIGMGRLSRSAGEARDGVIDLLNVAASHGEEQPALAAAALYAAQKALAKQNDAVAAQAVQVELLRSFPDTDHGGRLLTELGPDSAAAKAAVALETAEAKAEAEAAKASAASGDGGPRAERPRPGSRPAGKRPGQPKQKDRPR